MTPREFGEAMARMWEAPKGAGEAREWVLAQYHRALKPFDDATIGRGWERLRDTHRYKSWPSPADVVAACGASVRSPPRDDLAGGWRERSAVAAERKRRYLALPRHQMHYLAARAMALKISEPWMLRFEEAARLDTESRVWAGDPIRARFYRQEAVGSFPVPALPLAAGHDFDLGVG